MVRTTDTLVPSDAVIDLDGTRFTIDPELWCVAILRQDYDATNADNRPLRADLEEKAGIAYVRNQDDVVVRGSPTFEPVTIGYGFQNQAHVIYLTLKSRGPREHVIRAEEEVMRVFLANRIDPFGAPGVVGLTGRQWVAWDGTWQRFDDVTKELYERVAQFTIHWRFRQVEV